MRTPSDRSSRLRAGRRRAIAAIITAFAMLVATAPAFAQHRVTIRATGDVLVHRRVAAFARAHGFGAVFHALSPLLPADEIAFCNLESPLSESYRPPANITPPVLGATPDLAPALAACGFDVVSVANNHAFDQTADGLADTLAATHAAGLAAVGAGPDDASAYGAWTTERDGVHVAFLAFTERINDGPGANHHAIRVAMLDGSPRVAEAIAAARAHADVVVVSVHWSHDFVLAPTPEQHALAERLVRDGADVILGTGPHVLQPVERLSSPRGDAVVAYSLGNLVSNQGLEYTIGGRVSAAVLHNALTNPMTRDGVLLRVALDVPAPGQVHIASLEAQAIWTENNWHEREAGRATEDAIDVVPLAATDEGTRDERLRAIAHALGDAVRVTP